ncbi:MAG TPA: alpha/beta fold hydrolase [Gemmataceae bacterium]|nr:alpha/beta fold hydrolase [Gemmataceae bacterium]
MRDQVITTEDGFPLTATVFGAGAGPVVIINAATGVKRQYYRKFADWLASQGGIVVTYDYRGIGDSGGERTRQGLRACMRDWALGDAFAVLEWAAKAFPGQPITMVGHSFGGQCLGLLKNHDKISRVLLVGAQSGYMGNFPILGRGRMLLLWYLLVPVLTRVLGYFPARLFGLGEDLPGGVAREWGRWCRQPRYLMDDTGPGLPSYFDRLSAPILAYKIADDSYAPGKSVEQLLGWYSSAPVEMRTIRPEDYGVASIGHFGPFRETFRDSLWKELAFWALGGQRPAQRVVDSSLSRAWPVVPGQAGSL